MGPDQSFARDGYVVKRFASPKRPAMEELRRLSPSNLLDTRNVVVGFSGRQQERNALSKWRDDKTAGGRAVRLLWGRGGQGKTRLATQWAADSVAQGWDVLTAEHGVARGPGDPKPVAGSLGRLLLVDYAERWPGMDLDRLLMADPVTGGGPVRVLLLARAAGPWWEALQHRLGTSGYSTCDDTELGPLAGTVAARQAVFDEAVAQFAAVFDLQDTDGLAVAGSLADKDYRLALAVHMAALVAVDARVADREPPRDPRALSAYLLMREEAHWELMRRAGRVEIVAKEMGRVVTVATLTRPQPWETAEDLLVRACLDGEPAQRRRMLDDHAFCYPPAASEHALEPLLPDRLGEDFLAHQLPGGGWGGPGDPWCAGLPRRLLASADPLAPPRSAIDGQDLPEPDETVPDYRRSAWTMLIETSSRWQGVAEGYLYPLLEERPGLISEIGSAALTRLADYARPEVLTALETAFPEHRQVDLDAGIAAIAARLTQHRLNATDDPAKKAELHLDLTRRWRFAGLYDRALNEADRAVQIGRRLVLTSDNPGAVEGLLAYALMAQGSALAQLERRGEALVCAEEAVPIVRKLAQENPAAFEPLLASALIQLTEARLDHERHTMALVSAEEAVDILDRLARENRDEWDESLSLALLYLAMASARLGQSERAKAVGNRAIEITRWLVLTSDNPITYEPNLAIMLNNFGGALSDMGQYEEALASAEEAVRIFRKLAQENPAAFEPELLKPLSNLCNWLSKLGRNEEALAYADEAVPIVQKLAQTNRAAAEPGLARVLATRGASLWQLGQREEAKADLEAAVNIWQRLVQENPDAFRPHLAAALLPLGGLLSDLCLIHEARAAAKEAIEIYRRLAGEYPAKLSLAGALLILGGALSDVWLIEEARAAADAARAAAEEAARILREKARVIPDVFEPPLGPALCLLSASLAELGQHEEAKAAAGEAVHITRKLARENRAKYGHDLATALTCQRLAGENAGDPDLALAQALLVHVSRLEGTVEDFSTKAANTAEAMRLLMPPDRRARFRRGYAKGLKLLADALDSLGEHEQADPIRRRIANETDG